jgi:signal transduction histidine kinase
METTQPRATVDGATGNAWLREISAWVGLMVAALGLALLWLVVMLHPPASHVAQFAVILALSGAVSLGIGGAALRVLDATTPFGAHTKFAIPALLAAVVIALNTFVAARLMFISVADSLVLLAFLAFGACLALAMTASARLVRALRGVEQSARRIADGDYGARVRTAGLEGLPELEQMGEWFNHMAASVQDAFARRDAAEAQRALLLTALSHDMRTPLATSRAMIESIDDGIVRDPATVQRYHHAIRAEMTHLSALIDNVFDLARIEAGTLVLRREPLVLGDLISDLLEAAHEQAERRQIHLTGAVADGLPLIQADTQQIYRVLANLVQNALRHTPAGGWVSIQGRRAGTQIVVEVADTGEGIPPDDLAHIFALAFRGEASRVRRPEGEGGTGGGFGLAIARGIIEAHGGTIQACSPLPAEHRPPDLPVPCGTLIRFTLPG